MIQIVFDVFDRLLASCLFQDCKIHSFLKVDLRFMFFDVLGDPIFDNGRQLVDSAVRLCDDIEDIVRALLLFARFDA